MSNPTKNSSDNRREEILARSRQSGNDEGVEFVQAKGLRQGWLALAIVAVILLVFARLSDMDYAFDLILNSIVASVLASFVASPILAYCFTRDKKHLVEALIYIFFIVSSTIRIVSLMMRW
ncbi:MAG: DUF6442 family protein [Defluviitaleaceae bacterium]|nr:DUF6442 family protein [Defluviitaleaceae bacterium]